MTTIDLSFLSQPRQSRSSKEPGKDVKKPDFLFSPHLSSLPKLHLSPTHSFHLFNLPKPHLSPAHLFPIFSSHKRKSFTTPPKEHHTTLPNSPRKKSKEQRDLFSGLLVNSYVSEFNEALSTHQIDSSAYKTFSDKKLTIVKQAGSKSCGAACALMIALDKKRISPQKKGLLPLTDEFITWFFNSSLTKTKDLAKKLKKENLTPKILNFNKVDSISDFNKVIFSKEDEFDIESRDFINGYTILNYISNIIQKTNNSVIIAIDHPKIGGHWIIIDEINEHKVCLRDPYSGKAYKTTLEEIAKYITNEDCSKIDGLYLVDSEL